MPVVTPGHVVIMLFENGKAYCFDTNGLGIYKKCLKQEGVEIVNIENIPQLDYQTESGEYKSIVIPDGTFVCRHIANIVYSKLKEISDKMLERHKTERTSVFEEFEKYLKNFELVDYVISGQQDNLLLIKEMEIRRIRPNSPKGKSYNFIKEELINAKFSDIIKSYKAQREFNRVNGEKEINVDKFAKYHEAINGEPNLKTLRLHDLGFHTKAHKIAHQEKIETIQKQNKLQKINQAMEERYASLNKTSYNQPAAGTLQNSSKFDPHKSLNQGPQ